MESLSDSRQSVALHEAAHAAAARLLGRRVESVSIDGNGGGLTEVDLVRESIGVGEAGFVGRRSMTSRRC